MKKTKRLISLIIAASLLLSAVVFSSQAVSLSESEQSKINSYKAQQSELDEKIAEQQVKVDALKNDIEKEEEYLTGLRAQIANFQSKIDVLTASINELEAQKAEIQAVIDKINEEILAIKKEINHNKMQAVDSQHEIDDIKASLSDSLRDVYVGGSASPLTYLFACSDFSDYLIMAEIASNKAKRDEEIVATINTDIEHIEQLNQANVVLIEQLNEKIDENEKEIAKLDENEAQLDAQRQELEASQSEIEAMEEECMGRIEALDSESAVYQRLIDGYASEQAALDSKIDAIIAEAQAAAARKAAGTSESSAGNGTYSYNGSFIWPLQYGDVYISSPYGYRNSPLTGSYSLHGGVDTCCRSGTMNKNVVATAGGTVIYSSFNGYGNCVIIDHGSGFVSLYGHLNSRAVSVGQTVAQGQTIGYAGNTYGAGGYSTGAHLHFEIRVNGSKVNPQGYCSP